MPTQQGDDPHRHRDLAESFGVDPARYDRARPRYPDAMVRAIVPGPEVRDVLDVGCGTGIASRAFRAVGCRVLGVDVDARMAEFARSGGIDVEVAPFETWDPAGRTFDAVVAGQTWHWIDPVLGPAKAARVLRPGGRLAVFWNALEPPAEVLAPSTALFRRLVPGAGDGSPRAGYEAFFPRTAAGIRGSGAFGPPEEWRFEWDYRSTREQWLDQVPTSGLAARVPPAEMADLLAATGAAIDALGGEFTVRCTTVVVTAVLGP
ncbi:methyltransferase domain-containing protein [Actinosynnema sp. NPDC020468]|uniref:class I SAM-dependent methyltransferase n=1 Tax=Actinosynnema sp. NPDC020468 TaxID=3154488 RepID=UPI0033D2052F